MDINYPLKYRKIRIHFARLVILEVKTGVSSLKNTKHVDIALVMPSMQMDIKYPLKFSK